MTRFKLLLLAAALVLTTAASSPAKSDACFAYGICRSCTPTTSQPCFVVQCPPRPANYNCGSCTTNCVPPDI
ncbi:MAG TPA: hypothetical protein VGX68_16135 [Thermoanaerobaculia bacterium]|jgi:hypothetical protein|nr:hypothetical protein [Thermoanaerobaculia bacterium]